MSAPTLPIAELNARGLQRLQELEALLTQPPGAFFSGIGAGAASTIFSVMATRKQNGTVGGVPNILAPLVDGAPVLNTYYAPAVLQYLQAVPANEDPSRGTRIEQLKAEWVQSGRLEDSNTTTLQRQVAALTSSSNPKVKISINDLSNRIGMLVDVSGRVSLMKRDLAVIMRSYMDKPDRCKPPRSH